METFLTGVVFLITVILLSLQFAISTYTARELYLSEEISSDKKYFLMSRISPNLFIKIIMRDYNVGILNIIYSSIKEFLIPLSIILISLYSITNNIEQPLYTIIVLFILSVKSIDYAKSLYDTLNIITVAYSVLEVVFFLLVLLSNVLGISYITYFIFLISNTMIIINNLNYLKINLKN